MSILVQSKLRFSQFKTAAFKKLLSQNLEVYTMNIYINSPIIGVGQIKDEPGQATQ